MVEVPASHSKRALPAAAPKEYWHGGEAAGYSDGPTLQQAQAA